MKLFSYEINNATKIHFMKEAIKEAKSSFAPLPDGAKCGALVVKNGKIIGRGHREVICPTDEGKTRVIHAEQAALRAAGKNAEGADLYVTLEPCYERGNQKWTETHPPCSILIPEYGIERVIIGLIDKDPRTDGKGVKQLVDSGVKVEFVYKGIEKQLLDLVGEGKFYTLRPSLFDLYKTNRLNKNCST
jgi:diaminohydroxyphosphoribosylaminopyrimidine deaminase/5-amino-6-(5-phosphoribosylamino)uracil reductase